MGFYDDMAGMVHELLLPDAEGGLGQGTVVLTRVSTTAGPNDWTPGAETLTTYTLDAVVRRVETKYVDGTLIVATDNQITFAVPAIVPRMADRLTIDGKNYVMKDLRPIPAAGVPVAYIAFVKG